MAVLLFFEDTISYNNQASYPHGMYRNQVLFIILNSRIVAFNSEVLIPLSCIQYDESSLFAVSKLLT